jgi:subtilisin-like proprotein convertase family protein
MKDWSRPRLIFAIAAMLAIASVSVAVAGDLLTGADIANESISSKDVKGLTSKDLSPGLRRKLQDGGPQGPPGVQGEPGPQGVQGASGVALPGNGAYSFAGVPMALPDSTTTVAELDVPAAETTIGNLRMSLSISHTHDPDLDISLTHVPSGRSVVLFTDVPSVSADGFMVILDDDAPTDIGAATGTSGAALAGSFNPEGTATLSTFDGVDASGAWRLTVVDDAGGDVGSLINWTLFVTPAP